MEKTSINNIIIEDKKRVKEFNVLDFISKWGTVISIVLLFLFFSISNPYFLTGSNMITILRSISVVTIIAIGVTMSLTVNGLDLSTGSVATLASTLVVSLYVWYSLGNILSILIAIIISLIVALINSYLITRLNIPDMLATLAMMMVVEGVAMTYSGGGSISEGMPRLDGTQTIGKLPESFKLIGQAPTVIVIMLLIVLLVHIFLNHTKYGRYMYIIGGNEEAARLSGIDVKKYKVLAYLLSTFFAAIGGIVIASRVGSSQINAGAGYLMPAVAAAFIGFSVGGSRKANALGTFIGAVLVGVLENGMVMMSVPYYSLNILKGLVLVIALAATYFKSKK